MSKVEALPVIGSTTATLDAIADAYVNETSSDTSYGNSTNLAINFNSYNCFAYIMFDLSSFQSEITLISATLEVYAGSGSWEGPWGSISVGAHYSPDNSWTEDGIVWNNKPAFEAEATDKCSFGMFAQEGYKTWGVTNDVKKALSTGRLTEVFKFDSGNHGHMSLSSRESNKKPRLVIEYSTSPIHDVYLESAENTGHISNLGYVKFEEVFSALPDSLPVVAGSYQATYQSGYKFISWETTGGLSVSDSNSQTTTVTVSGSGTLRAVGDAETVVYAYDDGSSQEPVFYGEGSIFALRFSPIFRGKLEKASFYVEEASENLVKVHILDKERQDIVSPLAKTFYSEGWFDVDLSEYNIDISSEFYVGIEWTAYVPIGGGIDVYTLFPDATDLCWVWNGTGWNETGGTACMIRANVRSTIPITVLQTPTPPPTATPTPSPTPTSTPLPTPSPSPSPSPSVSPSPSPPPSPTPSEPSGIVLIIPREAVYAAVGIMVIVIIVGITVVLRRRRGH